MAFWGVVVKPGEPYTHRFAKNLGRLHVTKATIEKANTGGRYNTTVSSTDAIVECNVWGKGPILVCSFLPKRCPNQGTYSVKSSCSLDLEFEEEHDVVFTVSGTYNVHLTGYYLGNASRSAGEENANKKKVDDGDKDAVLVADGGDQGEVIKKMKMPKTKVRVTIEIQWKMFILLSFVIIFIMLNFLTKDEPGVAHP